MSETSEKTQQVIDDEVRRIVEEAHIKVTEELTEHRHNLDSLVAELMAHETLDQQAAYDAAGLPINREVQEVETMSVNGHVPDLDPEDGPEPIGGDFDEPTPD